MQEGRAAVDAIEKKGASRMSALSMDSFRVWSLSLMDLAERVKDMAGDYVPVDALRLSGTHSVLSASPAESEPWFNLLTKHRDALREACVDGVVIGSTNEHLRALIDMVKYTYMHVVFLHARARAQVEQGILQAHAHSIANTRFEVEQWFAALYVSAERWVNSQEQLCDEAQEHTRMCLRKVQCVYSSSSAVLGRALLRRLIAQYPGESLGVLERCMSTDCAEAAVLRCNPDKKLLAQLKDVLLPLDQLRTHDITLSVHVDDVLLHAHTLHSTRPHLHTPTPTHMCVQVSSAGTHNANGTYIPRLDEQEPCYTKYAC
jgi:hypothetical protein